MTRLIDADALLPMMKYATTDSEIGVFPIKIGFKAIAKVIDDAPTIDAVPVIRCKDCKHWESMPSSTAAPEIHRCRYWRHIGTVAYDFCGRAERKEE